MRRKFPHFLIHMQCIEKGSGEADKIVESSMLMMMKMIQLGTEEKALMVNH
jgi:hypothetical protein